MEWLKKRILDVLKIFNVRLVNLAFYEEIIQEREIFINNDRVNQILSRVNPKLINGFKYPKIKSQIGQEVFVLAYLNLKVNGFFVEFGASDGKTLSNTYVLEKYFGWNGICAEPGHNWRTSLKKNRDCILDFRCVYESSGAQINFKETTVPELSTIANFEYNDVHAPDRKTGRYYKVSTVSLNDLLEENKAPVDIDYISIDTEGSEYEILKCFNFLRYKVRIFSIEHNYTENREKIFKLLQSKGYQRVYTDLSYFDDWYVLMESFEEEI